MDPGVPKGVGSSSDSKAKEASSGQTEGNASFYKEVAAAETVVDHVLQSINNPSATPPTATSKPQSHTPKTTQNQNAKNQQFPNYRSVSQSYSFPQSQVPPIMPMMPIMQPGMTVPATMFMGGMPPTPVFMGSTVGAMNPMPGHMPMYSMPYHNPMNAGPYGAYPQSLGSGNFPQSAWGPDNAEWFNRNSANSVESFNNWSQHEPHSAPNSKSFQASSSGSRAPNSNGSSGHNTQAGSNRPHSKFSSAKSSVGIPSTEMENEPSKAGGRRNDIGVAGKTVAHTSVDSWVQDHASAGGQRAGVRPNESHSSSVSRYAGGRQDDAVKEISSRLKAVGAPGPDAKAGSQGQGLGPGSNSSFVPQNRNDVNRQTNGRRHDWQQHAGHNSTTAPASASAPDRAPHGLRTKRYPRIGKGGESEEGRWTTPLFKLFTGDSVTHPNKVRWYYLDDEDMVQGPFSGEQMIIWCAVRSLEESRLVAGVMSELPHPEQTQLPQHALFNRLGNLIDAISAGESYMPIRLEELKAGRA